MGLIVSVILLATIKWMKEGVMPFEGSGWGIRSEDGYIIVRRKVQLCCLVSVVALIVPPDVPGIKIVY